MATASTPASRFVVPHRNRNDATPSTSPNTNAWRVLTLCFGNGRTFVRFITESISASATQFNAFALPAAIIPPTRVAKKVPSGGSPRWANNIAGMVVTSSSSMTRGLISPTYARSRSPRLRAREAVGSSTAVLTAPPAQRSPAAWDSSSVRVSTLDIGP
nr:hypothetical protein GCM10020241_57270 [Streptoalloteichus tenebrarius]